MHDAALDWAVERTLRGLVAGSAPSPGAVMFLLRVYTGDGHEHVRPVLENALAQGLELVQREPHPGDQCEWLRVFDRAASMSNDERLAETLRQSVGRAVDGLERLVGSRYEPGDGLEGAGLGEHLHEALALLAAFEITGRLPYSMLADELVQVARRRWWDPERATFGGDFQSDCRALQLLCRLAALHADPAYTDTVRIARPSSYRVDAERVLGSLESDYRQHEHAAAELGLALVDWLALAGDLH